LVVPRSLIFVRQDTKYLLIRGSGEKRLWAGLYNGIGGHVERGEDILTAARRELFEETGLRAELRLCGTVVVDAGGVGVVLFIFLGEAAVGHVSPGVEGELQWVEAGALSSLPTVEDLPGLVARVQRSRPGDGPFSAYSHYDDQGKLNVRFAE
jgi:8-oxo-dGTP diphosphatase